MKLKKMYVAQAALLALLSVGVVRAQDTVQTTGMTTAPMSKDEMKAQKKQHKKEEKAANAQAKAAKNQAKAKEASDKAIQAQEKAGPSRPTTTATVPQN